MLDFVLVTTTILTIIALCNEMSGYVISFNDLFFFLGVIDIIIIIVNVNAVSSVLYTIQHCTSVIISIRIRIRIRIRNIIVIIMIARVVTICNVCQKLYRGMTLSKLSKVHFFLQEPHCLTHTV